MNAVLKPYFRPLGLSLALALLSACSLQPSQPVVQAKAEQQAPSRIDPQPSGSFKGATLYALLVAELAANRGLPQVTLHNYLREAERTQDINIARRATLLAQHYRDSNSLLQAAQLWHKLEPDNPRPAGLAATELIRRGQLEQAKPLLASALSSNSLATVDALAERSQRMGSDERGAYLALIDQLLQQQPDHPHLLYAKASLLRHNPHGGDGGDENQALALAQQALSLDPEFDRAILLEADLQARSGHLDTALGHLREELNKRDHKQIRTLYTRLLLQKGQTETAIQQGNLLLENHPNDHNLKFYLGALMLEYDLIDSSKAYFTALHRAVGPNSTLHYYLGRIAHEQGDKALALDHFSKIGKSNYLVAGMAEAAKMLDSPDDAPTLIKLLDNARTLSPDRSATLFALEAQWLTERDLQSRALETYGRGLEQHPDDTQLLYNRAMLSEQTDDLVQMEIDLRRLLELEPDNATALNALGYSLTDRTDRHDEALQLIRQALKLKPDDPAILDSMGWAHYNLGDYQLALEYLLRAYQSFPDPEIASHLGQVYWKLGQPEQARQIWNEALQRDPDSELILDAMRRAEQQ
ncbi:tetratricopeptide repeat protein [Motiliproteus sp.]|uniref:tetratricopeptide repeat protein n=1 Tax=Motiliproteus sp. TaxID=1898955 RepID=UPI003BACC546